MFKVPSLKPTRCSAAVRARGFPRWTAAALILSFSALSMTGGARAEAGPAARLEILSAAMVSHHVFRVRTHQEFREATPVTVTVPFPGTLGVSVTRTIAAGDTRPQTFDFKLDSLRVPRFNHTLRLSVRAEAAAAGASDVETAVVPLPVITIHGISPTAAFWGRRPETGFLDLERGLVRRSRTEWGEVNAYRRFQRNRRPERQGGYPTLFTFRWAANEVSLERGSEQLQEFLLLQVRPATWADRAVLIGWSRGGNLSRHFLSRYAGAAGEHPYSGAALLACMPATGSPVPYLWERYFSWLRRRPDAWNDVLPTYPWWRERAGPEEAPVPFVEREPENGVLERLNARERPPGVEVEVLFGTRTVRDTLVGVTASRGVDESPKEYGDFAVSRFSARGQNIRIDPADPRRIEVTETVPWLRGVSAKEFVFERRFRKPGVLHVAFLNQPVVMNYVFRWLQTHSVEEAGFKE